MRIRFAEQLLDLMVGAARFELATTCTPCRYATRLRYAPNERRVYQRDRRPQETRAFSAAGLVDSSIPASAKRC